MSLMARGIERRDIFHDDADRQEFLLRLEKALRRTGGAAYAWVRRRLFRPPCTATHARARLPLQPPRQRFALLPDLARHAVAEFPEELALVLRRLEPPVTIDGEQIFQRRL